MAPGHPRPWLHGMQMIPNAFQGFSGIFRWLVGGIPTRLKHISQLGLFFHIHGIKKKKTNHQPVVVFLFSLCSDDFSAVYIHEKLSILD